MVEGGLPDDILKVVNTTWSFNGESSDLVQQYFDLHRRGVTVENFILEESLPTIVKERLKKYNVKYDDLPGLAVRALLWDSGYILNAYDDIIPVKVWCGYSMAQIAQDPATVSEYKGEECEITECKGPNSVHRDQEKVVTQMV